MHTTFRQLRSSRGELWSLLLAGVVTSSALVSSGCSAPIWKFKKGPTVTSLGQTTKGQGGSLSLKANPQVAAAGTKGIAQQSTAPVGDAALRREPPLDISIAQAFFIEDALSVKVRVHTKTKLDPKTVSVTVSGLREGQVVEEQTQAISEVVTSDVLPAESTLALLFSLVAEDLTEYQVRCTWGDAAADAVSAATVDAGGTEVADQEARASLAAPVTAAVEEDAPPMQLSGTVPASLEGVEVAESETSCKTPPCDRLITVSAKVRNNTNTTLGSLRLAIGLYWVNSGMLPVIPKQNSPLANNEELITLPDLNIAPGQAKRIRVKVDRKVPVVPGGSFVPHLRVLGDSVSE